MSRIQKFDSSWSLLMEWGSHGRGTGEFDNPRGIAVDLSGKVFVADSSNHRIQVFDSSGNFLAAIGSEGSGKGEFQKPHDVAVAKLGEVFVGGGGGRAKVAVCQTMCVDSDVEGNIRRITKAVEEAAATGAHIAAFPETVFIGWVNTAAHELAEPIPGKFSEIVCRLARKHRMMISIGLTEKVEEGIYDSMILVNSKGRILLKHRKINTLVELLTPPYFRGKKEHLSAIDTPLGRIGVMVCADTFIDEHHQIMASRKPQLLLIPYGWAAEKKEWPGHGKNLERTVSRIAKNVGAATVGTNLLGEITTGPWKGETYEGHSVVTDSTGNIIAIGKDNVEEIMIVEVPLPRRKGTGKH